MFVAHTRYEGCISFFLNDERHHMINRVCAVFSTFRSVWIPSMCMFGEVTNYIKCFFFAFTRSTYWWYKDELTYRTKIDENSLMHIDHQFPEEVHEFVSIYLLHGTLKGSLYTQNTQIHETSIFLQRRRKFWPAGLIKNIHPFYKLISF